MARLQTKFIADAAVTNAKVATGIDAAKLGDGSVSNTEFQFINTLSSNAQTQLDGKVTGPASATDNAVTRYDGTTGKLVQNSGLTINDSNVMGSSNMSADFPNSTIATASGNLTLNPTGTTDNSGKRITSVGTPTTGTDAATKAYVDAAINGLDWKQSVRAATTAAGTLATDFEDGDIIDGVTLATGDRILIKNQASGEENGLYTVEATGAPTRTTDADTDAEVTAGMAVFVEEGTVQSDTGWVLTTDNPIVLDTTPLAFAQFSSAGTILAGTGLSKTGDTIDFNTADTSLTVNANDVAVNLNTTGGLETSSGVRIKSDTATANTIGITTTADGAGAKFDPNSFADAGSETLALAAGVAGAGLTLTSGVLAVGAGDGIDVAADSIAVDVTDFAGTGLESDGSNNLRIAASAAGAGLTGGAGAALAVGAGAAITVNADDVAVRVDASTIKVNGSNNLEGLKPAGQVITLDGTDITNQYVDLSFAAYSAGSIDLTAIGGPLQERGVDYTVSLTGGAGGVTRLTFAGDLATGGASELVATDKLSISYTYLT